MRIWQESGAPVARFVAVSSAVTTAAMQKAKGTPGRRVSTHCCKGGNRSRSLGSSRSLRASIISMTAAPVYWAAVAALAAPDCRAHEACVIRTPVAGTAKVDIAPMQYVCGRRLCISSSGGHFCLCKGHRRWECRPLLQDIAIAQRDGNGDFQTNKRARAALLNAHRDIPRPHPRQPQGGCPG